MYRIIYERGLVKFLKKVSASQLTRLKLKIEAIAVDSFADHPNLTSLKGLSDVYRLRVGNLRVIYEVSTKRKVVIVWKIGFRGAVYKK